ncbi:MAG: ribosomal protein L24 [Parcubacteria bacterium C7867-005]|nr:MAG: ribosomal protein L24 [Parcubacteria bacterium C7867-005]
MKIKKNDTVFIRSGKDKGKTGKVLKSFPRDAKVLVEGVNLRKRHNKAKKSGGKGEIVELAFPIPVSTVSLLDPKTKKPTRVGMKMVGGKNVRVAKKSGASIE